MNRLAAFAIVCAAAILFILVAYTKLSEEDIFEGLYTGKPQRRLVTSKEDYNVRIPIANLTLAGFGNSVEDVKKTPNTLPPVKANAVPDVAENASDLSSSVDASVAVVPNDVLARAHSETRAEQRETEAQHNENDGKPIVVLVLARMRTGSSLVGELFNQNPSLFYLFEPLHAIDHFIRRHRAAEHHHRELSTSLLRVLSKCQFTQDFLDGVAHWGLGKFKSSGLRPICRSTMGCLKAYPTQLADRCRSFGGRVGMKTIRADLAMAQPLVDRDHQNLKIIHLVRDPRGTANSRKSYYSDRSKYLSQNQNSGRTSSDSNFTLKTLQLLEEKPLGHVNTIVKYCRWICDTIPLAKARPAWLEDRYMFVRYEDMALDPVRMSQRIYDFVGLTMPDSVRGWVLNNTNERNGERRRETFGMHKNSKEVMQSWRHSLAFQEVTEVQEICGRAMDLAGYRKILRPEQLQDANFDTFEPVTGL